MFVWNNSLPLNNCSLPRCLIYLSTFIVNHITTPTPMNYIELTNPYFVWFSIFKIPEDIYAIWSAVALSARPLIVPKFGIASYRAFVISRGPIRNDDSLWCRPSNRTQSVDKYHKMDTRPWLSFMSKNYVLLQTLGIK